MPSQRASQRAECGPRSSVPKVNKSPDEVLRKITPPGAFIGLNFVDHRFTSRFPSDHEILQGTKYAQKTKDAAFVLKRTWEEAIALVHRFNWEKWQLLADSNPLPAGVTQQVPGSVPQDVLDGLRPIIAKLPALKTRS